MKHFIIWKQLTSNAFSTYLSNRIDAFSFFAGKLVRFGFFWLLIVSLFRYTSDIAGYTKYEVLLFFLTFNLVDVLAQAFMRGIYLFQGDVRKGTFDFVLSKPVNALFYSMSRLTDLLDFIFLFPIVGLLAYVILRLPEMPTIYDLGLYLLFLGVGLVIVAGIHIISAAISLRTVESENVMWLYRETMTIGRFPPEVLSPFLQTVFTFIIPIIVVVAFPTKALLGLLTWPWILLALVVAAAFFCVSLLLWQSGLRHYSSASS